MIAVVGLLLATAVFSFAQPQRPTEKLYTILAQAAETGWTLELRRDAGDIYIALGDFDAALAQWEAALILAPDDQLLMRRSAEMYVQRGRWPQALSAVRRLLAVLPEDGWANLHLGLILAPGDPLEAASALRRAAQHRMHPPEGLVAALEAERISTPGFALKVGALMSGARLYHYAERSFELAAALEGDRSEALALVALMRGLQSKDGQRWLDSALAEAPKSARVHNIAGLYYRAIGQNFLSLTEFAEALSLAPLDPELYAELGRSYELIGDVNTAAFWYGQALLLAPSDERYLSLQRSALNLIEAQSTPQP